MKRHLWITIAVALAACGSKDDSKTDNTAGAKSLAKGQALVEITISGEITKTLSGPIGTCDVTMTGGKATGATFKAGDKDHQLSIVATSEAELEAPTVTVNQTENRVVYIAGKTPPTVTLTPGKSATVEGDFDKRGAIVGSVHVKGTFTCGQ